MKEKIQFEIDCLEFEINGIQRQLETEVEAFRNRVAKSDAHQIACIPSTSQFQAIQADCNNLRKLDERKRWLLHLIKKEENGEAQSATVKGSDRNRNCSGTCPVCGGKEFEIDGYGETGYGDGHWDHKCLNCGAGFKENFVTYTVGDGQYYDVVDADGKDIAPSDLKSPTPKKEMSYADAMETIRVKDPTLHSWISTHESILSNMQIINFAQFVSDTCAE